MRFQELAALILAVGVFAHPTIHHVHHHHRLSLRSLRDVLSKRTDYSNVDLSGADFSHVDTSGVDFEKDVDWSKIFPNGGSPQQEAPPTATKVAITSDQTQEGSHSESESHAESGSGSGSETKSEEKEETEKKSSSGGKCVNLAKRATPQQDTYVGNYDGNINGESNCESSGKYSITFVNNFDEEKEFVAWNKIGKSGKMDGLMTDPDKKFKLGPGEKGTLTYGPNSQVGFALNCPRANNFGGVYGCNIGEANFNDQNTLGGSIGGSFYDVSMVTYNDIKNGGGSPILVPMKISADGWDDSTQENCVYTHSSQNSPVNPGSSGKCACGPNDARDFHLTATFG